MKMTLIRPREVKPGMWIQTCLGYWARVVETVDSDPLLFVYEAASGKVGTEVYTYSYDLMLVGLEDGP